ncbi:hypothetical protein F4777DRAFT_577179 [Nemania sp. FL0916]|nr:hypothetical protein F4777DRAFT_577179 [Nemania sp. FL0916]
MDMAGVIILVILSELSTALVLFCEANVEFRQGVANLDAKVVLISPGLPRQWPVPNKIEINAWKDGTVMEYARDNFGVPARCEPEAI